MYDELIAALRFCDNGECDGCCKYNKGKGTECYTLLRDAADAIEELSREYESIAASLNESVELVRKLQQPRWIPVTERLPERVKAHYLCYLDDDSIAVCYWSNVSIKGSVWEWHNPNWKEVTHWMPLPEPPKEEA